ncbi:glycosyltransferase family 4 protein [Protaetiibacter mangrovi]|uniref:Glycosyltransferase family 4 protein n=1 Tax=Protaetiibacter mangrovi TaxID=2970926 RepID=A0ABT1ZC48_9MICO|nr:glycosyltransferase family 1 protein [Protaetiibacter mangrovi]MCS0498281.1 glycosyltransferase family 4 protein [Protaetiibacter mangrovi]TPX03218.1 glycosyltransferase family 4 protein [Schumannella luteola]
MRILVDCRYTRYPRHDGISRFAAELTRALAPLAQAAGHELVMLVSDEAQLAMLPELPWELATAPTSPRELTIARRLNAFAPDVVFSPMQTIGSWGRRYGLVLTLHDLIYYRNRTPPRDLAWPIRLMWRLYHLAWWPQRLLLNRADEVATVSETTRELMRAHRLTDRAITVVSNAADAVEADPDRAQPPSRELVYMGSFMPYKNVETLARALHLLPGYRLHLLSRIGDADRARLEALAPADALVVHDGVTDAEYGELLDGALALVTMSLDEGFGLPLVEAMVRGTPIVVSDIPIFREIGGDAAVYADPQDVTGVAAAIRALDDAGEWRRRSAASRLQATRFDWDRSARALLELLERVGRRG